MKKQTVVKFVSSVSDEKRKWYKMNKLLTGPDWAARLQEVIDDYSHRGFRLIDTQVAYAEGDGNMTASGDIVPIGLLLFFESYD
jgi:hypothetical protein